MASPKLDLEFLSELATQFFRSKHLRQTLMAIQEDSITGWEKWLQIEFAAFLRQHDSVKAWGRESQYKLDGRLAKVRQTCAVDFIIHQKAKHSHLALEIKQIRSPASCINGMLKDIKKLAKIRKSDYDIRGVWCLGVHNAIPAEDALREVDYYAKKLHIDIKQAHVFSERIGNTGFSCTLL
jgi:hypothetical protein